MIHRLPRTFVVLAAMLAIGGARTPAHAQYQPTWESLARHEEAPEWFRDAKFGIYFHWGVYSVPAFGSEWYPRNMFLRNRPEYAHHVRTYGSPSEFGYHDLVPLFRAEHFDPEEWAELFREAGARFAGPVAEHHDGFSMWASEVNPWNVAEKGPRRDVTGELARAIRARGMKLITTFHHARLLQRYADRPEHWGGGGSHYPYHPEYPTSSTDPELRKLYGNMPAEEFHEYWFAKLAEVIDAYDPDIIWFDSWLNMITSRDRQRFAAYYLNRARERGTEVVITAKQYDLPPELAVLDIEKGGLAERAPFAWLTDDTMSRGSWSWTTDLVIKPARMVLHSLIDIVSKNGVLLLNVSPKADGTIPEDQREVLRTMGRWLDRHGEAIYGTRAWYVHGYGPTGYEAGRFGGVATTNEYTFQDIRFTQAKDGSALYVFLLGRPEPGTRIEIPPLRPQGYPLDGRVARVTLLGSGAPVAWVHDDTFVVTIPDAPLDDLANVLKLTLEPE